MTIYDTKKRPVTDENGKAILDKDKKPVTEDYQVLRPEAATIIGQVLSAGEGAATVLRRAKLQFNDYEIGQLAYLVGERTKQPRRKERR